MQIPEVWEEGHRLFCHQLHSICKATTGLLLDPSVETQHMTMGLPKTVTWNDRDEIESAIRLWKIKLGMCSSFPLLNGDNTSEPGPSRFIKYRQQHQQCSESNKTSSHCFSTSPSIYTYGLMESSLCSANRIKHKLELGVSTEDATTSWKWKGKAIRSGRSSTASRTLGNSSGYTLFVEVEISWSIQLHWSMGNC